MPKVVVQCKGSGRTAGAGFNAKRGHCSTCGSLQDINSNGRIRKHMRVASRGQLKKL